MDAARILSSKCILITLNVLLMPYILNVNAIKCFVCDSTNNPSCADLKSNSSIVAEECTPEKMSPINTWLFKLNELKYFATSAHNNPLFNCQKVVAREPNRNRMVTARFCQLHTADSDACKILENKMKRFYEKQEQQEDPYSYNDYNRQGGNRGYGDRGDYDRGRDGRRGKRSRYNQIDDGDDDKENDQGDDVEDEKLLHCSICSTDRCNAAHSLWISYEITGLVALMAAVASTVFRL